MRKKQEEKLEKQRIKKSKLDEIMEREAAARVFEPHTEAYESHTNPITEEISQPTLT